MNLVTALILFNILILIYQILVEIFTTLCRINGISLDKARFQVISLLTGTGFTTAESEIMLLTKQRRKLAQRIMLFSYIFNISIVSIFVNIFISFVNTTTNEIGIGILVTIANFILIVIINKSKPIRKVIDSIVVKAVNYKRKKNDNYISIYDTYGHKVIAEVELKTLKPEMQNKTIEEMKIKQRYNTQLLVIKRKEEIISEIWPNTIIKQGDTIIVFGKLKDIKAAFIRQNEMKEVKKEQEIA